MKYKLIALICLLTVGSIMGQNFDPQARIAEAKDRAAAIRAARIDAMRQLGESIKGVKINSRTTVKDFVTESDEINAQFEGFLQGAQQEGLANLYDDGTAEVKMYIHIKDVVAGLQKMSKNSQKVTASDVRNVANSYQGRKFEAIGAGAMKNEPLPPSSVDVWSYVSVRGKLMAKRAAQMDGYRNMAEAVYGIRLDAKTTVKDFVAENDTIKASFTGLVRGVQFDRNVVYRKEGICEISARLNVENFIQFTRQMAPRAGKNFHAQTFDTVRSYFPGGVIMVTGVGAPPARYVGRSARYPSPSTEPPYKRVEGEYVKKETGNKEKEHLAELERQRKEKERLAELERQRKEKEHLAELEKQRKEKERLAELERQGKEKERLAELERQRLAELERQRKEKERLAELERQKEKERLAELERQRKEKERLAELERQRLAEIERQRLAELERQRLAELERQRKEKERLAELERQRLAELERQRKEKERLAELERQRKERERLAELERQRKEREKYTIPTPPTPPNLSISPFPRPQLPPLPGVPQRFVPEWAKKNITATGTGVYPENMDVGQARAMARRAAQVDAYRLLAENALGVKLQSETTVQEFIAQKDKVSVRVKDSFIRGAETVKDRDFMKERYFEVDMKLYLGYMWEIIDAEYNKALIEQYGKKLESSKPADKYQQEFKTYQGKLDNYRTDYQTYQKELEGYHNKYQDKLSSGHQLVAQHVDNYKKYQGTVENYGITHKKHQEELNRRQQELEKYLADYSKYLAEYKKLREKYGLEAEVSLIPGPPMPPTISYNGPDGSGDLVLPKVPQRFIPEWAKKTIQAKGTGAYPKNMEVGQARAMAQRAAQVDAYRLLAETAMGLRLSSKTSVEDFIAESDTIKARVKDSYVRGAQQVSARDVREHRYFEVEMKLFLGDMWEIIDAEYNKVLIEKYGKKLEEFQPDQKRYKNEFLMYKARLIQYKKNAYAYHRKLNEYRKQYNDKLALNYPISKKYQTEYQKYRVELDNYRKHYNKSVAQLKKYLRTLKKRQADYDKEYKKYQDLLNAYKTESASALMQAPPAPPELSYSGPNRAQMPPLPKVPQRFVPEWAKKTITAKGTGVYPKNMEVGQAIAMAKRAAQVDGYRLLVENAMGVHLNSETTVKDFLTENDKMNARVKDSFLRGAEIVGGRDVRQDRYYEVDMKLYLGYMWEIIDAEYNKVLVEKYGRKLEEFQPDQVRYKTEIEVYRNMLTKYQGQYRGYQQKLDLYHAQQRQLLQSDHPVPKKYNALYQQYQEQSKGFAAQYQKYQSDLAEYQKELAARQAAYQKQMAEYKKYHTAYGQEADAALMPAPPMPPSLSFSGPKAGAMPELPKVPQRFIPDWAKKYVTATGTGAYNKNMPEGQAMAMAKRAAQVDAYRLLVENASGVHLSSQTTVKDFITQNDQLSARVKDSFLRGAQTIKNQDHPQDRYYEVTMKLFLGDMWEIIDAEYNKVLIEKYGKKLEDYQPDQVRYNTELELYQAQLRQYKEKSIAYQKELQAYYAQQKNNLSVNYPVVKRYQDQYRDYHNKAQEFSQQYQKYQQAVVDYQKALAKRKAEYEKTQSQFKNQYGAYKAEAEIALVPAPPTPPQLSFTGPSAGGLPTLPKVPQRFVPDWAKKHVTATGTGVYPQNMAVGQAMAMAKRAAQVDAYRLLVENAMGVHLSSETTVKDFITRSDKMTARVKDSFLRGAQTINEKDVRARRYFEVEMKLYLGDMWEIIDAEYNKVLVEKYGKKLEEFQPDQLRFKTEMQVYQAQLRTYKEKSQTYQNQLADYYKQYGSKIATDFPVAKKHLAEFKKFQEQSREYDAQYEKYQNSVADYHKEFQRRNQQFAGQQSQFKQQYNDYKNEAEIAMIPAPPLAPNLTFSAPSDTQDLSLPKPPQRFVPDWAKKYITASGTGVYPKNRPETQARAMARRAAQVDAYRVLAESAMGVHLSSETSVKNFLTQKDKITARVKDSFIRGAQEVGGQDFPGDRYYQIKMKLFLGDMWEIIDAEYNKVLMEKYGKKLEEFQPDQARFKTEVELYQAQLRTYKNKTEAYQNQLREYYRLYGDKLNTKYPVAQKYQTQYKEFQAKASQFNRQYQEYQSKVEKYQSKKQQEMVRYQQFEANYKNKHQAYQEEAEAALIPAPPAPPAISFDGPPSSKKSLPTPPQRFVPDWAKREIKATGTGVYAQGKPAGQAKLMAKRAAQVDAYRLLVESALGVKLKSETSVENFVTKKDKIQTKVNDMFLRGARVVDTRYFSEKRYCEVDMALYLGDMWKIIDAEYNKVLMKQYGQTLEQFQPDQTRYRTEMELYQARLRSFRQIADAYRKQLQDYQAQYGNQLAKDYPVTQKYREQYRKYQQQTSVYDNQYRQYQQDIADYQQEKEQEKVEYQQYKTQYQEMYQNYEKEAEQQ